MYLCNKFQKLLKMLEQKNNETKTLPIVANGGTNVSNVIETSFLDPAFVYDIMSVPSYSGEEYRMVEYIVFWALRHKVRYEFDSFGNIYLTKGELSEGEFYPCVTSHMDTVQSKHCDYINYNVALDLKTVLTEDGEHKIYCEGGIGIGADCKGGICISLAIMEKLPKIKACFFLDEERGCVGSRHLDANWFHDVGYVIGYDSPDLYRAAWSCSGVKLFSYDFYQKHMKDVCDKWGLKKGCFFSEPITDVMNIRRDTKVICMNFGNGGYNAHSGTEYSIIEHMDDACGMGIELIESIGLTRHIHEQTSSSDAGTVVCFRGKGNLFDQTSDNDDLKDLRALGDDTKHYTYAGNYNYGASKSPGLFIKEAEIGYESVRFIVERYERHISVLQKKTIEAMKKLCEKKSFSSEEIENEIKKVYSNEITF